MGGGDVDVQANQCHQLGLEHLVGMAVLDQVHVLLGPLRRPLRQAVQRRVEHTGGAQGIVFRGIGHCYCSRRKCPAQITEPPLGLTTWPTR
ncbi:hypothetical protein D3C75_1132390 [compost metagenome]